MRRFAPALGGRLSRRNIALSPHLWTATAATFALMAAATAVFPLATEAFDAARLWPLAGVLTLIAALMLVTRPPEPGTLATHAVLAAVWICTGASIVAYAPHGSATAIVGLFTGPLLAVWLKSRRAVAVHLGLASITYLAAAAFGSGDPGALFSVLCIVPAMWVTAGSCVVVLDAVERQGVEHERLALRDPLTGAGNRGLLDDALAVEAARHQGTGSACTLVQVQLEGLAAVNARVGRASGDGALATVAAVLADTAPPQSTVARITGDRFAVLLPDATSEAGAAFVERARRRLALVDTGGDPLGTRIGVASIPEDGDEPAQILDLSTTRCDRDLPDRRPRPAEGARIGALAVHAHDDLPVQQRSPAGTPSPDAGIDDWATHVIDRRNFASDRIIWRLTGGFFLLFSLLGAAGLLVGTVDLGVAPWVVVGAGTLVGLWILATRAPAIGTWRGQAVVAASYVLPAFVMASCAPHASWGVGTATFAGALIGGRLVDRRHIGAHLIAMTALYAAVAVIVRVDAASVVAILALLNSTWVLAACYVSVLEPAEAQAHRMTGLVLRDPLTGAGNARLLAERLAAEIPRHAGMQMPLVVTAIRLHELHDLARHHGPGAVAEVLRDVAVLLASACGPEATVARVGEDEFHLLIPLTDIDDTTDLVRDMRLAIADASRRGKSISPQIGSAVFPEDGIDGSTLVASARIRMEADDPRAHDLTVAAMEHGPTSLESELPARRRSDAASARRRAG